MRPLTATMLVASLVLAAPAFADGGHGRHHHRHGYWMVHRHHQPPGWGHWQRHRHPPREVQHYYYPQPAGSPSPGLHVIFPDIYIPWPQPR